MPWMMILVIDCGPGQHHGRDGAHDHVVDDEHQPQTALRACSGLARYWKFKPPTRKGQRSGFDVPRSRVLGQ